jgi:hypothetical protein
MTSTYPQTAPRVVGMVPAWLLGFAAAHGHRVSLPRACAAHVPAPQIGVRDPLLLSSATSLTTEGTSADGSDGSEGL